MRIFDVGVEAVGIVAIGPRATGVIAIGQLSTGIIAVGQLAHGVIVIGQVAVGIAALGQLVVALTWGGGMLGVVGIRTTPSLLVIAVAGEGHVRQGGRWRLSASWRRTSELVTGARVAALLAIAALVVALGLLWFPGYVSGPAEPPPTTYAPGTR